MSRIAINNLSSSLTDRSAENLSGGLIIVACIAASKDPSFEGFDPATQTEQANLFEPQEMTTLSPGSDYFGF